MFKKETMNIIGTAFFCLIMALLCVGLGELVIRRDIEHEENLVHDTLLNSGALIAQDIQRNIAQGVFVTQTISALLESNNYKTDDFEKWGHQIVVKESGASTVELAPGGVVSYIYPLEGNEGAIGHDLLMDKKRDDGARKAVKTKKITFVGPLKLIQNGKYAVIARNPIFRNIDGKEQFWGFSIALLLVDDILPEKMHEIERQGLFMRIVGSDPDSASPPVLYKSKGWDGKNVISMKIKVPNGIWILELEHALIYNKYYNPLRVFIFIISLTLFVYIFIQQYLVRVKQREILHLNKKLTELSLQDELTGVGNRRSGMLLLEYQMNQSQRYGQEFSVAMVDVDRFKQVNDYYGHPAGDQVLKHLTSCLKAAVRKSDSIFRLGGDEFLMVFPHTGVNDCVHVVEKILTHIKDNPCDFDSTELVISISIGLAEYKIDESIDNLLRRADMKLYEAKESGRDSFIY